MPTKFIVKLTRQHEADRLNLSDSTARPNTSQKIAALIERNKREGLLCACNQTRVPYNHPRVKFKSGILHGYEDCWPVSDSSFV